MVRIDSDIDYHTRNEESQIRISQYSGNSDQSCSTTRHNADILPCIFAWLSLSVVFVVQVCNGFPERFDASGGTILSRSTADFDCLWPLEASVDLVVDLWSSLAQVGPAGRVFKVAMLVGSLGGPHNTGGSTSRIKTSVSAVAFVRVAELAVNSGG